MPEFKLNGKTYSGSTNYASAISYTEDDGSKTTVQDKISELNSNIEEQNKNFEKIHNYSTDETVVGKWVDGKTIYRRHFSGNLISNGTYNTLFNENVNVINAIGSVFRASDGAHTVVGQNDTFIWNAINTPEVFLVVTDSFKGGRYDIVVEYTKN